MEQLIETERPGMELNEKMMESMNDPYAHPLPGAPMNDMEPKWAVTIL